MKHLIFLLSLFITTAAHASPIMSVQPTDDGELARTGQYHSVISCDRRSALGDIDLMQNLMTYATFKGEYVSSARANADNITQIVHFVALSIGPLSFDPEKIGQDDFVTNQNALYIPVFAGERRKTLFDWDVTHARTFFDACPRGIFLASPEDVFVTPIMMMTNENSDVNRLSTFIEFLANNLESGSQSILGKAASAATTDRIATAAKFVSAVETLMSEDPLEITVGTPSRLTLGTAEVISPVSNISFRTTEDPDYLTGAAPFVDNQFEVFQTPAATKVGAAIVDQSDAQKLPETCNQFRLALVDLGLNSSLDTAYVMHRWLNRSSNMSQVDNLRCLGMQETGLAHHLIGPASHHFAHDRAPVITKETIDTYKANNADEFDQLTIPNVPNETIAAQLAQRMERFADTHINLIRVSDDYDGLGSYRADIEDWMAPAVTLRDATGVGLIEGEQYDSPFKSFKTLTDLGFERFGCVLSLDKVSDSTANQLFDGAHVIMLAFQEKHVPEYLRPLDGKEFVLSRSIALRLRYGIQGDSYKLAEISTTYTGVRQIAEKTGCASKFKTDANGNPLINHQSQDEEPT